MGYELSNGAIELQRKRTGDAGFDIVLALFNDEFVTWLHNKRDDAFYHGHYFGRDLESALDDFREREII